VLKKLALHTPILRLSETIVETIGVHLLSTDAHGAPPVDVQVVALVAEFVGIA
jgi:hypothetical protein